MTWASWALLDVKTFHPRCSSKVYHDKSGYGALLKCPPLSQLLAPLPGVFTLSPLQISFPPLSFLYHSSDHTSLQTPAHNPTPLKLCVPCLVLCVPSVSHIARLTKCVLHELMNNGLFQILFHPDCLPGERRPGQCSRFRNESRVTLGYMQFPSQSLIFSSCRQAASSLQTWRQRRLHRNNHLLNFKGRKIKNMNRANCWLPQLVPGHYKWFNSWCRYHCDRSVPYINMNTKRCRDNQDQAVTSPNPSSMAQRGEFYMFCVFDIIICHKVAKRLLFNNYIT